MKILFLHGYTQSGPLFNAKTKALQKTLTKALSPPKSKPASSRSTPTSSGASTPLSSITGTPEFYFPTGPLKLSLSDLPGRDVVNEEGAGEDSETDYYAWWRKDNATGEYFGLEETWKFLSNYLDQHGPFVGVVGFSQGAALAVMLASALERREAGNEYQTKTLQQLTTSHPRLRFAVSYSGFLANPGDERYTWMYEPKVVTPTLHFIGSLDTVVDEARSLAVVDACEGTRENGRVVYHPGGHYLPTGKAMVNVLVGFMQTFGAKVEDVEEKEERVEDMELPF